jgi:hypothetical protein
LAGDTLKVPGLRPPQVLPDALAAVVRVRPKHGTQHWQAASPVRTREGARPRGEGGIGAPGSR